MEISDKICGSIHHKCLLRHFSLLLIEAIIGKLGLIVQVNEASFVQNVVSLPHHSLVGVVILRNLGAIVLNLCSIELLLLLLELFYDSSMLVNQRLQIVLLVVELDKLHPLVALEMSKVLVLVVIAIAIAIIVVNKLTEQLLLLLLAINVNDILLSDIRSRN